LFGAHLPPLPLDIRLWEEGLANSFKALLMCNGVDQALLCHHTSQSLCRFLTLASYGFAFGTGGDNRAQWLAGMANE
jgi:hypothetical protein